MRLGTIAQPADRDPPQPEGSSAVGARQHEAASDPIALGNLVNDIEGQIVKQCSVDRRRSLDAVEAVTFRLIWSVPAERSRAEYGRSRAA